MSKRDDETLREVLSREGLNATELEAAVLAYKIANNLPLEDAPGGEAMTEKKRFIAQYVRGTSGKID